MTETTDVSPRARPILPRGFADRDALDIAAAEAMMAKIREVYALYGFEAVETPFVEYTDALGKFLPDQDRPNEGVFSFKDDDEQWLSLRYDLTAPLARYVAENYDRLPKPYRSYRAGWVFRNEKPGPGRFRQFMQFDADTVGSASPAADAEICMMAADCLEALGIERGDYVIKVNNRKVLDGVMEAIGLGGEANAGRRLTVLRAIDKLDRLGVEGVRLLLGAGRKDESGDFTKGAELGGEMIAALLGFLSPKFPQDVLVLRDGRRIHEQSDEAAAISVEAIVRVGGSNASTIESLRHLFDGRKYNEGLDELSDLARFTESGRITPVRNSHRSLRRARARILHRPRLRGGADLSSYGRGRVVQSASARSAVAGATMASSRAFARSQCLRPAFRSASRGCLRRLRAIKSPIVAAAETPGPVVVLALDRDADSMANYQRLVASLRNAGIAAELYLGSGGMNAQLKYADRRRSRVAVIQGSNERNATAAVRRSRSATSTSGPNSPRRPRTAPTIWNCASAPNSPWTKPNSSSGCARFWRGVRADCVRVDP